MSSPVVQSRQSSSESTEARSSQQLVRRFQSCAQVASLIVIAVGSLVLTGWLLDLPALRHLGLGHGAIWANAGISFVLAGLSLLLQAKSSGAGVRQLVARLSAVIVGLAGLATTIENLAGSDLGVDWTLLPRAGAVSVSFPGPMAINMSLSFLLFGLSLLLLEVPAGRRQQLAIFCTFAAGIVSFMTLIGYAYGVPSLCTIGGCLSMPLTAALTFAVLCLGLVLARSDRGPTAIIASDTIGGWLARRLFVVTLGIPLLLGCLRLSGEQLGLFDRAFGVALLVLLLICLLAIAIVLNSSSLDHLDIERQQSERELMEVQEFARSILLSATDAFIAIDSRSVISEWNAQAEKTFGWTGKEAVGKQLPALIIPAQYREAHTLGMQRFAETGQGPVFGKRLELTALHKEGHEFPIELSVFPVKRGKWYAFCAFVHDISERKLAEKMLLEAMQSEQRLARAIVEHAPVGIARMNNDLVITEVNRILGNLAGASPEEIVGMNLLEVLPSLPAEPVLTTAREGTPFRAESYKIVLGEQMGGHETYWDLAMWPIRDTQQLAKGVIFLATDVTERVKFVRQREDLIATITHDLKTPIVAGDLALGLLIDDAYGSLQPSEREVIVKLKRSHRELLNMIENLLDVYRYESGTERLNFQEVELAPLVVGAVEGLGPLLESKQLRVTTNLPPDLGFLEAHPIAVSRVLSNLLSNSIKFTDAGGAIEISGRRLADSVFLQVRDSGVGIAIEDQKNLFQRFWRSKSTEYKPGSGLGLYLCGQIIESHHGSITCVSDVNQGTTFSINLPIRQPLQGEPVSSPGI